MPSNDSPISDHVRGAILEEIVLYLLELVGYRVVQAGEEGTRASGAGMMVQGRGEEHQIDGLAAFDGSPAFIYPLRLLVEAKCYRSNPVGIEIVRNSVGTSKDITENYFSLNTSGSENNSEIQVQRFNYHAAIFSTSGYSRPAQRYAIAHQIFLIQYKRIALLEPVVESLMNLQTKHFVEDGLGARTRLASIRKEIRVLLHKSSQPSQTYETISNQGIEYINQQIVTPLLMIKGSYYGMLQGRWPLHLISDYPLPAETFSRTDKVKCKVFSHEPDRWYFSPTEYGEDSSLWFKLGFDLPESIARIVNKYWLSRKDVAGLKQSHFSFLDVSGKIGGVQRQVRLELDEDWLSRFISSMRRVSS